MAKKTLKRKQVVKQTTPPLVESPYYAYTAVGYPNSPEKGVQAHLQTPVTTSAVTPTYKKVNYANIKDRGQIIDTAIDQILSAETDENKRKQLETLLRMTNYMENKYGASNDAWENKKTNLGFVELDKVAINDLFTPKGDKGNFTKGQKNNFEYLKNFGLPTNQKDLEKLLLDNDPLANMAVSRLIYATNPKALPKTDNANDVFNYWLENYNHKGALKHQNQQDLFKIFQEGYKKYNDPNYKPNIYVDSEGHAIIDDNMGQWAHPGEVTRIASNDITMQGVPYPVLGVGADGEQRMMYPNEEHTFNEAPVTEYPMMEAKDGGWLNQYQDGRTSDYDMLGYATHHPLGALKHMINPEKFHGTDEYKRPNHMTFSDESKYSNTEHTGGHWSQTPDGKWTFTPTEFNIQNAGGPEKYQQWWDETEGKDGNILILPQHKRGGVTWLNEYAKGNTVYVSSATDPKYRRYKDSLDLYNYYKLQTQLENPSGGRMPGAGQGHEYNSVGDVMNTLSETGNTLYNMYSAVTPLTDEQKKNDEYLFRVASDIIKNNPDLTWGTDFPGIGKENYQAYKNAPEHSPDIKTKDGSIKATGTWMGYARNNNYANTQPTQTVVVAPPMSLKKGDVYKTQYGEYEIVGNPTPGAGVKLKNKKTGQESEVNYQDMASHIYNKDASVSTPPQQKTPPPTVVKTTTATTTPPVQQPQTTPPTATQTPVTTTPPQTVKKTTAPFKPKTGGFYASDGSYWRFDENGKPVRADRNTNQGYEYGGEVFSAGGEKHRVYRKESPTGNGEGVKGHIMVTHPTMDKGKWDTIDLTEKSGAKTVAEGIAATRKWHEENPEYQNGGYTTFLSPEHQFLQSIYSQPTNQRNQYLQNTINQYENIVPEEYSYTPRYTKSQKFSMPTEKPIEIEDSFLDDLIFRNHHSDEKPAEETKEVLVEPTATTVTETPAKLSDKPQANKVSDKLMTAFQRSAEEYKKAYPNRPSPVISSGFRSREKQEQLYANRANNPFPVAKPGTSKHEHGLAIDVGFTGAHTDQDYANFAAIMNKNGVKWLGSRDKVHFQLDEAAYGGWLNTYE
jgi:LAS superfamily LD-carboxypeptidase LdcB